ncbi:MAG TPA: hypothetical protein EYP48_01430 [Ignisphaera sp.]|uniref:MoaD/ThiS family protein n=1 Tax=Ignisphaera aggregans TaxID=334771 RepID=A0A832YZP1_9CREN|nr:hypothetical protein [Ignisphaera sp.]HIP57092.1 hypothetical protein [Ignisphaera aggregans]
MPKILLMGSLRNIFGCAEISLDETKEMSFTELIRKLCAKDKRFEQIFEPNGAPRPGYLVLVDQVDVRIFDDMSKILVKSESVITIIPVVHGG